MTHTHRVAHYGRAVTRWSLAGFPQRSDEEVAVIWDVHCEPCEKRNGNKCEECGCYIVKHEGSMADVLKEMNWRALFKLLNAGALVNKIRMRTEHCNLKKW